MKNRVVSFTQETAPEISGKRLKAMTARAAGVIDTNEIPEADAEWFRKAIRGRFYRPVKAPVTARLDVDVVAWLKKDGKGYQSRMNNILRRAMLASLEGATRPSKTSRPA